MAKIKLLIVDEMGNGTLRLQSQLMVGRDSVDFILKDGVLKNWSYGEQGTKFYKVDIPYELIKDAKDMTKQEL